MALSMVSSMASNAILAKARAMYGKSLSETDYKQLMDCRNVSEVAAYLKTRTNYKDALTGLNENEVHRGQLEPILRQTIYYDIFALSRYAMDKSLTFTDFIISQTEIDQIIRCLTLVNIGKPEEYIYTMPSKLAKMTKIDIGKFVQVRSYDDMISALAGTKYAPAIRKFRPKDGERINIALLEAELNNHNFATVIEAIRTTRSGKDRDDLLNMITAMLDFRNISRIIRLKKYYHYDKERIIPLLIPYGRLSEKTRDEICEASSVNEVYDMASSTYLGKQISRLQYNDVSQLANALLSMYCKHHLRLSPNPTIVMISYYYLKEIELANIVNIIEATRYGLSSDEKEKMLVR